jgi:energy-coupling factor transporter ATP-binding protein EcfA2
VKEYFEKLGYFLFDLFLAHASNSTLVAEGFDYDDPKCLKVNTLLQNLYCIELTSSGNIQNYLSKTTLDNIYTTYKDESFGSIVWALYKKDSYQKNYIFSYDKKLLELIAYDLDVKFVDSIEMLNVLYDLFLNNDYKIENNNIKREISIDESIKYETMAYSFSKIIQDDIYKNLKNIDVYQAFKYYDSKEAVNLNELFSLEFEGAVWSYIDFSKSKVLSALNSRIRHARVVGEHAPFLDLKSEYEANSVQLLVMNSVLFLKQGDRNSASRIGNKLKIDFKPKSLFSKDLIRYTLLKKRDTYWDMLVDREFLDNYISVVHKKNVSNPDFCAIDLNNSFWNYAFTNATDTDINKNAHILLIGVTGSGKTTNTNKMFAQIMGYESDTKRANLESVHYRDFDVKKSGLPLANLVGKKNSVDKIIADLNSFRYNILSVQKNDDGSLDLNDIARNSLLVSLVLESINNYKDKTGLSSKEESFFMASVIEIYENKKYETDYIEEISSEYKEYYEKILALGYKPTQRLSEVQEDGFDHFKVPKLRHLLKHLQVLKEDTNDQDSAAVASSLYTKLKVLQTQNIFSHYDSVNIKNSQYLYMDFDLVKDLPHYIPIFVAIFTRVFTIDKHNQRRLASMGLERPRIYYHFAEAANLFYQPSFELLLKKLTNEARSDKITIMFSTQLLDQVPEYITKQVGNLIVTFPSSNKKEAHVNELVSKLSLKSDAKKLLLKTPEYGMAIINEHNINIVKQQISEDEILLFGQE